MRYLQGNPSMNPINFNEIPHPWSPETVKLFRDQMAADATPIIEREIGICPVRMKILPLAMMHAFAQQLEIRIFPHLSSAVIIPVTAREVRERNLVLKTGTNVYQPARA